MNRLKTVLAKCSQSLNENLDSLEEYKSLDPRIDLFFRCVGMLSTLGSELENSVDDLLSELSGMPDNFTEILNDVNLLIRSSNGIVVISASEKDKYPPEEILQVKDTNFVAALLKIYDGVRSDTLGRKVHFSARISGILSEQGSSMTFNKIPGCSLELDDSNTIVEFNLDTVGIGQTFNGICEIQATSSEAFLHIKWLKPFVGRVRILEN
jgi:hypothetical protein